MKHLCLCSIKVLLAKIIRYPIAPNNTHPFCLSSQFSKSASLPICTLANRQKHYNFQTLSQTICQAHPCCSNKLPGFLSPLISRKTVCLSLPPRHFNVATHVPRCGTTQKDPSRKSSKIHTEIRGHWYWL